MTNPTQAQLERRILAFLDGFDPTPRGVIAQSLVAPDLDVQRALTALVESGHLLTFKQPNGTVMYYVPQQPDGGAAA